MENNERRVRGRRQRKTSKSARGTGGTRGGCLFYETQGVLEKREGGGDAHPDCIAYATVSPRNGDSQRAERVVIRNMG
jgi:hypothetical protein